MEEKEKERHWECEREKVGRCVASEMKEREGEGMFTDTRYCLLCELLNSLCVCVCSKLSVSLWCRLVAVLPLVWWEFLPSLYLNDEAPGRLRNGFLMSSPDWSINHIFLPRGVLFTTSELLGAPFLFLTPQGMVRSEFPRSCIFLIPVVWINFYCVYGK